MIIKMAELKEIETGKVFGETGNFRVFECKSFHVVRYNEKNIDEINRYSETGASQLDGVFVLSDNSNHRINMITRDGHQHILWNEKDFNVYILNNEGKTVDRL